MSDPSHALPLARLQADALFAGAAPGILARLLGALETVAFAPNEVLCRRGDPAAALYLIESGEARLTTPTGRELPLQESRCGEEAAAGLAHYACTVTAATPLQAWRLPKAALADLAKARPGFAAEALLSLASHLGGELIDAPAKLKTAKAAIVPKAELVGWASVLVAPPLIFLAGLYAGFTTQAAIFTAILAAAILMWVFSLVDEFVPPLVAVVATLFIGLAPPTVALAGFASSGLMTLLGVFALSATISISGLSYRLMLWILLKLPDRPVWQQSTLLAGGYLLSPITPSGNSRLSLLLPLYRDMLDGLRLPKRGIAATGLMAAAFAGAMLFSPMLSTSKSSNITAINLLPTQVQEEFLGLFWLAAAGVAAIGLTLLHLIAMRWLFPGDNPAPLPKDRMSIQLKLLGPMSGVEKIALGGFAFFLIGAGTVSWHHIQPSWIAGCVLIGLLLSGVFGKQEFRQQLDWPMVFFLLGMDSITRIMSYLGLDTALARAMNDSFSFIDGRIDLFILAALATTLIVRLALPITAGMLVSVIILLPVANAQEIHPWICVFLTALFSDIWFLPYQSSVYLQVVSQGLTTQFDEPRFMRYNQWMNLARVAVAFLSIPYWQWLDLA
ncbi:MAG: anion permease [Candidatus Contendobacter sp.]|jgi:DASS family divalent anion:Na+ symporter|nr:anion permease [Gammaproteobacteria bacterium]MCC8994031.1 anion permease [Candidatus Contendobacter sp.]